MPRIKSVIKLETLCLNEFCQLCALTCSKLEIEDSEEDKFKSFLVKLPKSILEQVISQTLKIVTAKLRKNRAHKGLLKAVECLPQSPIQKLDFGSLYSEVRVYGHVNSKLKDIIQSSFENLPNLIELNLSSKCTDLMLVQLAKNCHQIQVLSLALSDITDRGLLALAGISMTNEVRRAKGDGCYKITNLNVQNCAHISSKGKKNEKWTENGTKTDRKWTENGRKMNPK